MKNKPLGIFDSGMGGLTVLRSLHNHFPKECFVYYADTARAPYGNRTKDDLLNINTAITNYLLKQHAKCIIFACNTSCALIYPDTAHTLPVPSVELIYPAAKHALSTTKNKRIAILATSQTIDSKAYSTAITSLDPSVDVFEIACPKLVPFVESNTIDSEEGLYWAKTYLDAALKHDPDTIIHGCSHYPFFEPVWKQQCSEHITFINPAHGVAQELDDLLHEKDLHSDKERGTLHFYISGESDHILKHIHNLFNKEHICIHNREVHHG